jgi:L-threonylcarbamoyladenylate synthase
MYLSKCSIETIRSAAQRIASGHLVAFPTETVYGIGADATNEKAVARIYKAKGRPVGHPLIIHISSMDLIEEWASDVNDYAIKLARDFWPGPLTLVLNSSNLAQDFVTGGQQTVGLRVPNQPIALALIAEFEELGGFGIAAPSANRFGAVSPTTAQAVNKELANYLDQSKDLILDGGPCLIGVESTIVDCTSEKPRVLRPGAITTKMIMNSTGLPVVEKNESNIRVSGSFKSHYSPNAKVLLDVEPKIGEGYIAMASFQTPVGAVRLATPKTVEAFAREIYSALRDADSQGLTKVCVIQPEGDGLAAAIRDRLGRAAN